MTEVLPLGENCHLGVALSSYGHHESSLLRWAQISLPRLQAWLDGDGPPLFQGRTAFRISGLPVGTFDQKGLRDRLVATLHELRVNTIVFDADGESYIHGIQVSQDEAAQRPLADIETANSAKINFLRQKFFATADASPAPLFVRLEWSAPPSIEPYERLTASLRRRWPAATLFVVSPPGARPINRDGLCFVFLRNSLPLRSDVMNVKSTGAEFARLFSSWGVQLSGTPKPYMFGV